MHDEHLTKKDSSLSFLMGTVSRRHFILSSSSVIAFSAFIFLHRIKTAQAGHSATLDTSTIHYLSELLTAKTIDPSLATRAGQAITRTDPSFPAHITALKQFLELHNITDIEALKSNPGFEGEIKTAAQKLISALYLGYAGQPVMLSSDDNVEFVTYREALTYRLTKDYTPVPSYSRETTGYWASLPEKARN
ncbi:sugar dehydrogenase complex small subunit [Acetobacteraceae bacterium ESL0709]|nr:sugar dehydrogenase complex small subunit [Acetobacteraceae bacterium ESL0697]MDF7678849.1 sugar dehydrogenase complex small subunit [Acetobacteraceae bacterium ESL0709]